MEKAVKGATKIKLAAPKTKYVEPIMSATRGGETGVADVFNTLQLRLRDSTWTIVFKALIVVHLMIREGSPDVTLKFLAENPKRLAISQFTEVQTQGVNIRRYFEYLLERVKAYQDADTDFVRNGSKKMRSMTVDKGLLRHTEIAQSQIRALLKCDLLGGTDPDNEISMTAYRLVNLDLLELYQCMNEGTINILEHFFEMSKVDAQRSLNIYKTFARQTDLVVTYLSTARQYQTYTRLEVPKLKHAPTTLTSSLEEYLNDADFDTNRRQYLLTQEAKRTGKPVQPTRTQAALVTRIEPLPATIKQPIPAPPATAPPPEGPAPDLIDFFESIEQNQQPMAQQTYQQPPNIQQHYSQAQIYQQPQMMPQQTGYNPFVQNVGQMQQPQTIQPNFTGAGFGGYGPQPQQAQTYAFSSPLTSIPQGNTVDFSQQQFQQPQQVQAPQALLPQPTSTNPFRQSMMVNNTTVPPMPNTALNRQSTNPFAKPMNFDLQQVAPPPTVQSPVNALAPQKTGTNPFAKTQVNSPVASTLPVHVTGSTNPFRQSQFVNQQTGQGWQHSNQGTMGGFDINGVQTSTIFPRPGAQQS